MNKFYTADTHFFHDNIIKYCERPFSDSREMNDYLFDAINDTVQEEDKLYFLGDLAFPRNSKLSPENCCRAILDKINCKNIVFIMGNHDYGVYEHIIQDFYKGYVDKIGDRTTYMQHDPMNLPDAIHSQCIYLHGHLHSRVSKWHRAIRSVLDVGVDSANVLIGDYRPFSEEEVLNLCTYLD